MSKHSILRRAFVRFPWWKKHAHGKGETYASYRHRVKAPVPTDPLVAFADWFLLQGRVPFQVPSQRCVHIGDGCAQLVLHREPPFQVELVLIGSRRVPPHAHPNVDSIEVILGGYGSTLLEGILVAEHKPCEGLSTSRGYALRIRPGELHGGDIPEGAAFLSIQHWLDGEPRDITEDWVGPSLGSAHKERLRNG